MPIQTVNNIGEVGIVKGTSPHELPVNVWTDGKNVHFADGVVYGPTVCKDIATSALSGVTTALVSKARVAGSDYLLCYGTNGEAIVISGGTSYNVTSTTGNTINLNNSATIASLSGIPIVNRGIGAYANPIFTWDLQTSNKFIPMPNWPANTNASAIRSYKNFLVALCVSRLSGGSWVDYPYMVKWSHPADPGALPSSWDQTDATKDAGEYDLAEGGDIIIDGAQLRSSFMIYKNNSIWRMDNTGGPYVHSFTKVIGTSGALSKNCIAEINGQHFVVTNSDIIIHDGASAKSIFTSGFKKAFFSEINVNYTYNTFVVHDIYNNEVLVVYPYGVNQQYPNKALVYNYRHNTTSFRELAANTVAYAGCSGMTSAGLMGDGLNGYSPRTILASGAKVNLVTTVDGSNLSDAGYIERVGLALGDTNRRKVIRGIRPRMTTRNTGSVTISVGYSDTPYGTPTYTSRTYYPGSNIPVPFLVDGRYLAIKFEISGYTDWRLDSYDIEFEYTGAW